MSHNKRAPPQLPIRPHGQPQKVPECFTCAFKDSGFAIVSLFSPSSIFCAIPSSLPPPSCFHLPLPSCNALCVACRLVDCSGQYRSPLCHCLLRVKPPASHPQQPQDIFPSAPSISLFKSKSRTSELPKKPRSY